MQHAAYTAYLEAAFDAVLAAEHAEHVRRHALPDGVLAAEHGHAHTHADTPLEDEMCVCGYLEPPPRSLNDQLCYPCEARKAVERQKEVDRMNAEVDAQLALPEGDPKRIFTDKELRDTANVHCDKRGFNRTLLRAMRKRLGIPLW